MRVLASPAVVIWIIGWFRLSSKAVNESSRCRGSLGNKCEYK